MDKRFLAAFTDPADRIKILGRFVSPFSLLRRVQLQAIESPFVCPDKDIRPSDLLIAVKICAGEPISKPTLKDSWYLGRMRNEAYFVKQLSLFSQYVLLDAWPKFWEKESKGSSGSGIPWVLNVVASLMKNGVSEERAWTMPESQAIWLHSAIAISKGADIKVLTFEEEELIKSLDKQA
jgi:hypothetical protein